MRSTRFAPALANGAEAPTACVARRCARSAAIWRARWSPTAKARPRRWTVRVTRSARRRASARDRARDHQQQSREDRALRRGSELGPHHRGGRCGACRARSGTLVALAQRQALGRSRRRSSCSPKPRRTASSSRRASRSSSISAWAKRRRPAGAAISRATTCASTRTIARDACLLFKNRGDGGECSRK